VQQGRNLGGKKNTAPESARILISISTVVKIGVVDNVKKIATQLRVAPDSIRHLAEQGDLTSAFDPRPAGVS
jgi:hypothetical protein